MGILSEAKQTFDLKDFISDAEQNIFHLLKEK
jgi:hypothetical protein